MQTAISKAGRNILKTIAGGNATAADFPSGRARALQALRRAKLVTVTPIEVKGLQLTEKGEAMLSGKSAGGSADSADHRVGSAVRKAYRIIDRHAGSLARGKLIAKIVRDCGVTANTASTYIYNHGKLQ